MATHGARPDLPLPRPRSAPTSSALRPMTERNEAPLGTAFTVSIEAREGVTTGISAADRSHTIQVAIAPGTRARRPRPAGSRLPAAREAGRRARADRPDRGGRRPRAPRRAQPVGRRVRDHERRRDDGARPGPRRVLRAARPEDDHRRRPRRVPPPPREARRARARRSRLPTAYGDFTAIAFREILTGKVHVALVRGEVDGAEDVLVRVHSECLTGDVFHSLLCDCGEQLEQALAQIAREGRACSSTWRRRGAGSAS